VRRLVGQVEAAERQAKDEPPKLLVLVQEEVLEDGAGLGEGEISQECRCDADLRVETAELDALALGGTCLRRRRRFELAHGQTNQAVQSSPLAPNSSSFVPENTEAILPQARESACR